MGFLRDLTTLTAQSGDLYRRMDVGAQLAAAQTAMGEASRAMSSSMPVATTAADEAARLHTTATVVQARQLPMLIGVSAVVELDLHVRMPGGIPLPVTRTEQLAPLQLARVQPGATVAASIVPGRPDTTRLEWGA